MRRLTTVLLFSALTLPFGLAASQAAPSTEKQAPAAKTATSKHKKHGKRHHKGNKTQTPAATPAK